MMVRFVRDKAEYFLTAALSSVLFFVFYGFKVLNPFYVDWMLCGGDPSQHYLGWALYRYAPFRLQLGLLNTAAYPFDTSIIFTDSLPLMAVPCKFIGLLTDENFQFFGIWGLLCIVLTGVLSCHLLKKYIHNSPALVAASILVAASSCMLRRIFWHSSLAAHFLIILGLILIAYRNELCDTWQRAMGWWAVVAFLCAFVHLYFLAMDSIVLFGFALFVIADRRENHLRRIFSSIFGYLLSAAVSVWLLGGFSSGMSSGAPGLGYYSFNLNGFFDPDGWSAYLPNLSRYTEGQYEGFAYLGLGVIAVFGAAVIGSIVKLIGRTYHKETSAPKTMKYYLCAALSVLVNILVAASNEITFGGRLIVEFSLPEWIRKIWEIFRASGRLIWPAVYIIAVVSLVTLARLLKGRMLTVILVVCVVLQIGEMYRVIEDKHAEFTRDYKYENRIDDPKVIGMIEQNRIRHIVFLDKDNLSQDDLYSFTELATRYRLTVNDFYFARYMNYPATEIAYHDVVYSDYDTLFVISDKSYDLAYMFPLEYYQYKGLLVGVR